MKIRAQFFAPVICFSLALIAACSNLQINSGPENPPANQPADPPNPTFNPTGLAAFPGAEGFGATATGGRGGQVIYVSNLNAGGPGSLNEALRTPGPRYILFKVSGVIDAAAEIIYGNVTIAGQSSPGGITVRGLICDEVFEPEGDCTNVIVRHLRSRPRDEATHSSPNYVLDDALRLDGVNNAIFDHLSLANATDETIQISQSSDISIQNTLLAEPVGTHAYLGGMLINYSTTDHPMDRLSIHHNLWNRVGGRMPEISCESPECAGRGIHMDLSYNMAWDPRIAVYYNPSTDPGGGGPHFHLNLNWVNNYWAAPPSFTHGMLLDSFLNEADNQLFFSGNQMNLYPGLHDEQLAWCCNDFNTNAPNTNPPSATMRDSRHHFPALTDTPTSGLRNYMIQSVGALPRDPMDRRLIGYLQSGIFSGAPIDADQGDAWLTDPAPAPPIDSDNDGMPDAWETSNGLDPNRQDHNGTTLSLDRTGADGYTNLEVYLNELADGLL